jgi:hypothetical protein
MLPIFYPPTSPEELHSEPRQDLSFYIIDSHRPWDLNNVFLKEGGVFCVDDGDIEIGLAVEGGIGTDYEVLLEVRSFLNKLISGRPCIRRRRGRGS